MNRIMATLGRCTGVICIFQVSTLNGNRQINRLVQCCVISVKIDVIIKRHFQCNAILN